MASVPLQFVPPDEENLTSLLIYEAPAADGPFALIETVTPVGSYPDYINNYTTNIAANADDWFAIQWKDDKDALTTLSAPIKGGTTTVLDQIVKRVRQRDSSLSLAVIAQEAEGVIQSVLGIDPYSVYDPSQITYTQMNGLTYLVMARSMLDRLIRTSNVTKASIGLVSMQSGETTTSIKNIEALIELANNLLGQSLSLVMLLEDVSIAGGSVVAQAVDASRLVLETEFLL